MNAATQRPGTDLGASYATVFRIHGTEKYKSIAKQCLQAERVLPWQRIHRETATYET
jgi:glutamate/tyrosine decarboxylase-like PLP-dependent enzyme